MYVSDDVSLVWRGGCNTAAIDEDLLPGRGGWHWLLTAYERAVLHYSHILGNRMFTTI